MSNGTPAPADIPTVQFPSNIPNPVAADQFGNIAGALWLNDWNQKLALQRLVYAQSYGLPGCPPNSGLTMNYVFPQSQPPAAGAPTQPVAKSAGGVLKAALIASAVTAAVAGTGGWLFTNWALSKIPPAQAAPQSFDSDVSMEVVPAQ